MTTPEEAARKRESIAEELRKRREILCDPYTGEWIQRQLAGVQQELLGNIRLQLRTASDLTAIEGRTANHDQRLQQLEQMRSIIGELRIENLALRELAGSLEVEAINLREELTSINSRIADMSRWATEIHKWALSKGMPKTTDSKGQS